jgi:hypothetical protein
MSRNRRIQPVFGKGNQVDIDRIEHQFNRNQDDDGIPFGQCTVQAYAKKDQGH